MSGVMLAIFCSSFAPSFAPAEEKPRVLVLNVRSEQGIERGTANLLGELLLDDVHKSGKYTAISFADMVAVLDVEQQKQVVGCADDARCLAEIGSALGADLLIEASVGVIGATRVLALKLIDVRAVKVLARETETVSDDEALIAAMHRLAAKLLGPPEAPPPPIAIIAPPTPPPERSIRPGWWVAGGGAVVVAAGAVIGALALGDLSSFENRPFDDALGDAADTKAAVADVLYVAGGITLAAGIVWLLVDE